MAEAIVIKIQLTAGDLSQSKGEIRRAIKSALDAAIPDAKEIGKKIGDVLASGMAEGLAKARQLRSQLDQVLDPTKRHRAEVASEARHQQKLVELEQRKQAQIAVIRARAEADAEKSARRIAEAQEKALNRAKPPDSLLGFFKRYSSTLREAGESIQQAGFGLAALTGGIFELGRRAVQGTIEIDKQVNTLRALTGSAEAAEKRYAALIAVAQKTPGLTTSLAATLDAQLRVASVTESTINKILPAIGKLNAVSTLGDPQKFAQNLVQLVTQGFERTDLKELVGQSPLAGELIKQVFNVDSPTNAKAIRESAEKLGLTSTEAFFTAFAEAAAKNSKLANVTESLGAQFDKLIDRVTVALRPLGLAIVNALTPLIEKAVPVIERLSKAFADLSPTTQQIILALAGVVAVIGPLTIALGGLIQAFGAIGNIVAVVAGTGGLSAIATAAAPLLPILAALAAAAVALFAAWQTNFGGIRDLTGEVARDVTALLSGVVEFTKSAMPQIESAASPVLNRLADLFRFWSETVGGVWRGAWELIRTTTIEALDVIRPAITSVLALLTGNFQQWKEDSARVFKEAWDFFITVTAQGVASIANAVQTGIRSLLDTTKIAESVGKALGINLIDGIKAGFIAAFPGTAGVLRSLVENARSIVGAKDAQRSATRSINADAANALAIEEELLKRVNTTSAAQVGVLRASSSGGGSSSAESKARQIREAQLAQQKSFIEQSNRLLEDANKRELEQFKQLYDDKQITIREFYDAKLGLTQASVGNEINALQQEILAQERAFASAKAGTPEKIRLETELFKLRTELTLKTRELSDIEIQNLREFTKAALEERQKLLAQTQNLALKLNEGELPSSAIAGTITPEQERARQTLLATQKAALDFRVQDLELQQQEIQIQNAINAGILTEAEGKSATLALQRQYRDALIQSLEIQKQATINPEEINRLNVQIEQLRGLGLELTPLQALFKGFRSQAETLAESFERIGSAFKDKVLGVVDSGIDRLTSKLGFFKSLVGDILKSLTRVLLGGLLQPRGGSGGGGLGGFLGNLLGGGSGGGGGIGSFLTGGFSGGGGAASILGGGSGSGGGGLLGALSSALGGDISAPRSLSLGGLPIAPNIPIPGAASLGGTGGGGLGSLFSGLGGGLGNLFKGIGFGKAPGSGGQLAGALPLLGLSLGSSLGTDRLTSILGGVAGGLLGVGLSAAPGIIGAGGALSGLGFLAPLFSNPITAIAAGLALPAIFLLGRARQRRRDERSSGDFLQDAINQIRDIKKQVESNELTLTVSQARAMFDSQVLQPFIAQINTLKTKSVRESRLKNQTADLRNLFEKEVIPAVQAQKTRQGISDKLIPEFAVGGYHRGVGLALLHDREAILNLEQQARLQAIAGHNVLQQIGVPNAAPAPTEATPSFARGGIFSAPGASRLDQPMNINMTVQLVVSGDEAVEILNAAANRDDGQQVLVNARKVAARNRLTR